MHALPSSQLAVRTLLACLALSLAACGDDDGAPPITTDAGLGISAVFELAPDPIDFGRVPFPDDLYLDDGHVALGALPRDSDVSDPEMLDSMRLGLREVDGFGASSAIYFAFEGAIDPASLPATPGASLSEDASAFLVVADPASSTAFERVPVTVRWNQAESRLSLQPMDGHPLTQGTRYAAVVTSGVRDAAGLPVRPAAQFAAIRDAAARPEDPLAAEAYDRYAPVIASLATEGTPRDAVVALAVFTVQHVSDDLADARALVHAEPAPALTIRRVIAAGDELDALLGVPTNDEERVGLDAEGGVPHSHIGWVIDGTFESAELASPAPDVHGRWTRDEAGQLVVKRRDTVWFTLVLPAGVDLTTEDVPVIVYQHGLGSQRGTVFGVADTLCAAGFAVAAIDIPFHGMRAYAAGAPDNAHAYGSTPGPDLYGDTTGQEIYINFLGVIDTAGELVPFHPMYTRDVFRQAVVNQMTLVRALRDGDWSVLSAMSGPTFRVDPAPLGFVGISLGGILGTVFVANEPEIGAAMLSVTGGHLSRLVEMSPSFSSIFLGLLMPRFGYQLAAIDWERHPVSSLPEVAVYQTLLDGGDSMAHAATLAQRPVHLLMHLAEDDETVPNVATESLARALGAPLANGTPAFADLDAATLPVTGNVRIGADAVTRVLVAWEPANHGMLAYRHDAQYWQHPLVPPFVEREAPLPIENPVDAAQQQMRRFFETWRDGPPEAGATP